MQACHIQCHKYSFRFNFIEYISITEIFFFFLKGKAFEKVHKNKKVIFFRFDLRRSIHISSSSGSLHIIFFNKPHIVMIAHTHTVFILKSSRRLGFLVCCYRNTIWVLVKKVTKSMENIFN